MNISETLFQITPIKAFSDNYIWTLSSDLSPYVWVVDPGDAAPVLAFMNAHDLQLESILITHHHYDHTDGVKELKSTFDVPVYGPATSPIDCITHPLADGDTINCLGLAFSIFEVPGHTLDHIAYLAFPEEQAPILFCGDTLFAAGCGRLFEGSAEQMYTSLNKLATLPDNTRVFCTHEYTLANLAFAKAVEPSNPHLLERIDTEQERRDQDLPTLPSSIALERLTNPFLRANVSEVIESVSSQLPSQPAAVDVFAALRQWKDSF